jgi:hypothetical protein
MQNSHPPSSSPPSRASAIRRAILVAAGLGAWFWTQSLLGHRTLRTSGIGDYVHQWTAPLHDYLFTHDRAANAVLIASSAVIDAVGVFLILAAIFGKSIRPFLALLMLFALRQICQSLCALPPPDGMIWHATGVPTLLVTYGTSSDLFFSGHTALAVLGAAELARLDRRLLPVGILIALGEASAVLVLRAHYTMDVFTGAVTALYVSELSAKISPLIDRKLR